MDLSIELVGVLLILLPGFVTARVIAALFVTKPTDSIDRISWALVWAFVDYMALQILALWLPGLIVKDVQWASLPDYRSQILLGAVRMPSVPLGLCALFGVAVAVGIVAAAFCTHDCHMWLLRRCKATLRTTHASVWADAFHGYRGGGVLVQLTNGTKLWGVPKFFADTAEEGSLLLGYPYLVGNDGTLTDREIADQILLTGATRIESVMFTPGPQRPGAARLRLSRMGKWLGRTAYKAYHAIRGNSLPHNARS